MMMMVTKNPSGEKKRQNYKPLQPGLWYYRHFDNIGFNRINSDPRIPGMTTAIKLHLSGGKNSTGI